MQQYEKEIRALELKNKYLQGQMAFESSMQKRIIFFVSLFVGAIVAVFLIIRPANVTDGIVTALVFALISVLFKFIAELIARRLWKRFNK